MQYAPASLPNAAPSPTPNASPDMGVMNPMASPFQRSVARQRAEESMKAATYASLSPLPHDQAGNYSGAFGNGPQAEQSANAARTAFVQTNRMRAYDINPNLEQQELRADANARANAESGAKVKAVSAYADLAPLTGDEMRSRTAVNNAKAKETETLAGPKGQLLGAQAEEAKAKGRAAEAGAGKKDTEGALRTEIQSLRQGHADKDKIIRELQEENRQYRSKLIPPAKGPNAKDAKMEKLFGGGDGAEPQSSTMPAPTQADFEHTAQKYGITVEEVKRRLGMTVA